MPIHNRQYQDALDYFYASESEDEYFSAEEGKPQNTSPSPPNSHTRIKRTNARRNAQFELKRKTIFSASDQLQRLPDFIPPFNDRTVSSTFVNPSPEPKIEKRWRSSTSVIDDSSGRLKGSRKISKASLATVSTIPEIKWSVDENELTIFNVDGAMLRKYKEFKKAIYESNCSPLNPKFESRRWDIKSTQQKDGYILYSARLNVNYRVKFLINKIENKVMIFSVSSHD